MLRATCSGAPQKLLDESALGKRAAKPRPPLHAPGSRTTPSSSACSTSPAVNPSRPPRADREERQLPSYDHRMPGALIGHRDPADAMTRAVSIRSTRIRGGRPVPGVADSPERPASWVIRARAWSMGRRLRNAPRTPRQASYSTPAAGGGGSLDCSQTASSKITCFSARRGQRRVNCATTLTFRTEGSHQVPLPHDLALPRRVPPHGAALSSWPWPPPSASALG